MRSRDYIGSHGQQTGHFIIQSENLVFERLDFGSNRLLVGHVTDIRVSVGGINSPYFVIHFPNANHEDLTTTEVELIRDLEHLGNETANEAIEVFYNRKRIGWMKLASPFIGFILVLLLIPLVLSEAPTEWIDRIIPFGKEIQARPFFENLADQSTHRDFKKGAAAVTGLEKLLTLLTAKSRTLAPYKIEVRVDATPEVNAYALPGGIIVVNRGLIERAESIDEVVGILGHELAHIELRHTLRGIVKSGANFLSYLIISLISSSSTAGNVMKAGDFLMLGFSRDQETQADDRAYGFLKSIKVSPNGLIHFFERLERDSETPELGAILTILSTHPLSGDRIAALKARMKSEPFKATAKLPVTLSQLKAAVKVE